MLKNDPNLTPITTKEVVRAWGVAIRVNFDASNAPITMRKEQAVGPAGAQSLDLYYIVCVWAIKQLILCLSLSLPLSVSCSLSVFVTHT